MSEEPEPGQDGKPRAMAEIVDVPTTIRTKVSGSGPLTREMLSRAENVIVKHGDGYIGRAQTQLDELVRTVHIAKKADRQDRPEIFDRIFHQSHDIRGMGTTFGYNLVTAIGASLCNFLETVTECNDAAMEVVSAHADALRAVIGNDVKGDGGSVGLELVESLAKAVEKVAPLRPEPERTKQA
ncbi:MAG: hypothetical protein WD767_18075 [Alphaproteobacteria bacterium]